MNTPLDKSEFEALADFRYQLRRFLRFSYAGSTEAMGEAARRLQAWGGLNPKR